MARMRFGLGIGAGFGSTVLDLVSWVKLADENGFDSAWLIDSQMLYADVYASLAACALNTKKIKLGPGVTVPQTRHITVTANAIKTINELSGHRAVLGLGPGNSAMRTLGLNPASREVVKRTGLALKQLLAGNDVKFHGRNIRLQSPPSDAIPVYLAATGPKMLQLAGEIGDGAIVLTGVTPGLIRYSLDNIRKGAEDAKRSFGNVDVNWFIHLSVSQNRKEAREEVRAGAASAANIIARVFEADPKAAPQDLSPYMKEIMGIKQSYDYQHHVAPEAEHGSLVSEDLIDMFEIAGTPDDCVKRIDSVASAGIDQITLALYGTPHRRKVEVIRLFSEEVMPSFN